MAARRAAAALAACAALARGELVLPTSPPAGFNSFMGYQPNDINATSVPELARLLAASPLGASGYSYFVIDGGWSNSMNSSGAWLQNLDGWGRPVPAPERFPGGSMQAVAAYARSLGLDFGLWHIRGVHVDAVTRRLPVKGMEQYTLDQIVDSSAIAGGKNGSCLWAPEWLGVNASHPAAQAYYDSIVDQLVSLGATTIKAEHVPGEGGRTTTPPSLTTHLASCPPIPRPESSLAAASSAGPATATRCASSAAPSSGGLSGSPSIIRPAAARLSSTDTGQRLSR